MNHLKQKFDFQSICDRGAVRPNNEDAIAHGTSVSGEVAWMLIADGMGGHNAGEVASGILVDEIQAAFDKVDPHKTPKDSDWQCWIEIELNRANNKIFAQSVSNPDQSGMGTTAVLVIIQNGKCSIGWVGDSRAYFFRDSGASPLSQVTQDHTMVQMLLDKGAITKKEASGSNNKNMLSKAIGVKKGIEVDTVLFSVQSQDIILLSTDGLHDSLEYLSFQKTVGQILQGVDVGKTLVKEAIENGSKDNITFGSVLIKNDS